MLINNYLSKLDIKKILLEILKSITGSQAEQESQIMISYSSNSENNLDDLNMLKEFNNLNCKTFFVEPKEGTLLIFPSNLSHGTKYIDKNFKGERLALVGDVNLILKEEHLK